jgi:ABC-type nitrate/sulfonate/bicarbonate transport system substrate-binding protein
MDPPAGRAASGMAAASSRGMRFAKTKITGRHRKDSHVLQVGYAATIDCAVLIAAQELGLFRKHGLEVHLSREVGWTTIREKLLHEELDAAAAHASMLFTIYCGIGVVRRACVSGMLLGRNGSAITLATELWNLGVRDAATLGKVIHELKGRRHFTFGVVQELSSQNFNLRKWLRSGGIDPDHDVRVVVIPSALMHDMLRARHLDGYCVAEPWNSAAVLEGTGWTVVASSEVEPNHPEKALLVLQEFAEKREEEHLRLIAALIEASQFCDVPENRPELARMLAQPDYFDVDKRLLTNALVGPFQFGHGRRVVKDFVIYDALQVGAPSRAASKWVFDLVHNLGGNEANPALRSEIIPKIFREDIFNKAIKLADHLNGGQRDGPFFRCGARSEPGPAPVLPPSAPGRQSPPPADNTFTKAPPLAPFITNPIPETSTALCV